MSDLLNSQIDSEQQKIVSLESEKSPEKLRQVLSKKKDLLVTKVDESQSILASSMQKFTSQKAKEYLESASKEVYGKLSQIAETGRQVLQEQNPDTKIESVSSLADELRSVLSSHQDNIKYYTKFDENQKKITQYNAVAKELQSQVQSYKKKPSEEGQQKLIEKRKSLSDPVRLADEVFGNDMHSSEGVTLSSLYNNLWQTEYSSAKNIILQFDEEITEKYQKSAAEECKKMVDASKTAISKLDGKWDAYRKEIAEDGDSPLLKKELLSVYLGFQNLTQSFLEQFPGFNKTAEYIAFSKQIEDSLYELHNNEIAIHIRKAKEKSADYGKYITIINPPQEGKFFVHNDAYQSLPPEEKRKVDIWANDQVGIAEAQYRKELEDISKQLSPKVESADIDKIKQAYGEIGNLFFEGISNLRQNKTQIAAEKLKQTISQIDKLPANQKEHYLDLRLQSISALKQVNSLLLSELATAFSDIKACKEALLRQATTTTNFSSISNRRYEMNGPEMQLIESEFSEIEKKIRSDQIIDIQAEVARIKQKVKAYLTEHNVSQQESFIDDVDTLYQVLSSGDKKQKKQAYTKLAKELSTGNDFLSFNGKKGFDIARQMLDKALEDDYNDAQKKVDQKALKQEVLDNKELMDQIKFKADYYIASIKKLNPSISDEEAKIQAEQASFKEVYNSYLKKKIRQTLTEDENSKNYKGDKNPALGLYNQLSPYDPREHWYQYGKTYTAENWEEFKADAEQTLIQTVYITALTAPVGIAAGMAGRAVTAAVEGATYTTLAGNAGVAAATEGGVEALSLMGASSARLIAARSAAFLAGQAAGVAVEGSILYAGNIPINYALTGEPVKFEADELGESIIKALVFRGVGSASNRIFGRTMAAGGKLGAAAYAGSELFSGAAGIGVDAASLKLKKKDQEINWNWFANQLVSNVVSSAAMHYGHKVVGDMAPSHYTDKIMQKVAEARALHPELTPFEIAQSIKIDFNDISRDLPRITTEELLAKLGRNLQKGDIINAHQLADGGSLIQLRSGESYVMSPSTLREAQGLSSFLNGLHEVDHELAIARQSLTEKYNGNLQSLADGLNAQPDKKVFQELASNTVIAQKNGKVVIANAEGKYFVMEKEQAVTNLLTRLSRQMESDPTNKDIYLMQFRERNKELFTDSKLRDSIISDNGNEALIIDESGNLKFISSPKKIFEDFSIIQMLESGNVPSHSQDRLSFLASVSKFVTEGKISIEQLNTAIASGKIHVTPDIARSVMSVLKNQKSKYPITFVRELINNGYSRDLNDLGYLDNLSHENQEALINQLSGFDGIELIKEIIYSGKIDVSYKELINSLKTTDQLDIAKKIISSEELAQILTGEKPLSKELLSRLAIDKDGQKLLQRLISNKHITLDQSIEGNTLDFFTVSKNFQETRLEDRKTNSNQVVAEKDGRLLMFNSVGNKLIVVEKENARATVIKDVQAKINGIIDPINPKTGDSNVNDSLDKVLLEFNTKNISLFRDLKTPQIIINNQLHTVILDVDGILKYVQPSSSSSKYQSDTIETSLIRGDIPHTPAEISSYYKAIHEAIMNNKISLQTLDAAISRGSLRLDSEITKFLSSKYLENNQPVPNNIAKEMMLYGNVDRLIQRKLINVDEVGNNYVLDSLFTQGNHLRIMALMAEGKISLKDQYVQSLFRANRQLFPKIEGINPDVYVEILLGKKQLPQNLVEGFFKTRTGVETLLGLARNPNVKIEAYNRDRLVFRLLEAEKYHDDKIDFLAVGEKLSSEAYAQRLKDTFAAMENGAFISPNPISKQDIELLKRVKEREPEVYNLLMRNTDKIDYLSRTHVFDSILLDNYEISSDKKTKFFVGNSIGNGGVGTVNNSLMVRADGSVEITAIKYAHEGSSLAGEISDLNTQQSWNKDFIIESRYTDPEGRFIVYETSENTRDLYSMLTDNNGQINLEEYGEMMQQVVDGLSEYDKNGYAFGDLKESNVLVFTDKNGKKHAKLIDPSLVNNNNVLSRNFYHTEGYIPKSISTLYNSVSADPSIHTSQRLDYTQRAVPVHAFSVMIENLFLASFNFTLPPAVKKYHDRLMMEMRENPTRTGQKIYLEEIRKRIPEIVKFIKQERDRNNTNPDTESDHPEKNSTKIPEIPNYDLPIAS